MRARDRRYGKSFTKTRVGIATAALAGGAVAIAAVLAGSHGASTAATSAAYSSRAGNEGTVLSSVMSNWNGSRQSSYAQLSRLTQARQFSQAKHKGKMVAIQRGIVVLATKKFLILQSSNRSLHLWLLSGKTKFQNVSNTMAGTQALTASTSAAQQAMRSGNMNPATSLLAGSTTTAAAMLTPAPAAQTVTVQVANTNLTVTVTVTRSMATVSQTATMPQAAMPTWNPVTWTQNAWQATHALARGDLALVVGTRSHWTLHAQLVLFTPLSAANVGGTTATGTGNGATPVATPTAAPTHW
jgi:hypothetical protein